jgi:hypothetical protein
MSPHSFSRIFLANYSAREEQLVDVWPVVSQFHLLAPDWRKIVGSGPRSIGGSAFSSKPVSNGFARYPYLFAHAKKPSDNTARAASTKVEGSGLFAMEKSASPLVRPAPLSAGLPPRPRIVIDSFLELSNHHLHPMPLVLLERR